MSISPELRWLLDRVCEYRVSVRTLLPEVVDQVEQWGKPCPSWSRRDVLIALHQLALNGLVELYSRGGSDGLATLLQIPESETAFLFSFEHGEHFAVQLTRSGGQLWEQHAHTNWNLRYVWTIRDDKTTASDRVCEITAGGEETARMALAATVRGQNLLVIPGTERYSQCGPWSPTYWKTLDAGVMCNAAVCECTYSDDALVLPSGFLAHFDACTFLLSKWYSEADAPSWKRPS